MVDREMYRFQQEMIKYYAAADRLIYQTDCDRNTRRQLSGFCGCCSEVMALSTRLAEYVSLKWDEKFAHFWRWVKLCRVSDQTIGFIVFQYNQDRDADADIHRQVKDGIDIMQIAKDSFKSIPTTDGRR